MSAEYHGADTIVTAQVNGSALLVRAPGQVDLAAGSQVKLGWEPGAVHIFDSQGERHETVLGLILAAAFAATAYAQKTELTFYYPIAVGGPLTKVIDGHAAGFEKENPDIKVNAVYAGNYDDTRIRALAAHKAGQPAAALGALLDRSL